MKAEEMWDDYSRNSDVKNKTYEAWSFGSEPDKLVELVLQGVKIGGNKMSEKKALNWIIAIIVAVFYLLVSIVFDSWTYSWLIWVVYAIYRLINK